MPPDKVQGPLVKDVEQALLNRRKRRRKFGDVSYPIPYSSQAADFDIWDHMLLRNHCKSLTHHPFVRPPSNVLDIGCGSGYWIIEAAKQWPTTSFVGFDAAKLQPKLEQMEHLKSLSRRINWVHGNFLDGLPFQSETFDFVRLSGLGLAIPEDEWHHVLGEIHRLLTPGGVLEIIEEDLLFPCASAELQLPFQPLPSPNLPLDLHKSKSTTFSDKPPRLAQTSSLSAIQESGRPKPKISTFLPSFSSYKESSAPASAVTQTTSASEISSETEHPQDHTRLKTAWEAMLSKRFLSSKLLSVLPFYLTSASLDAKVHQPLVVPLPPNSGVIAPPFLKTYRSMGSLRSKTERDLFDRLPDFPPPLSIHSIFGECTPIQIPTPAPHRTTCNGPAWGTIHLAKTVNTIKCCKEAIFEEYKQLYFKDALNLLSRTAPSEEEYWKLPASYLIRASFEVDWRNWEYDMTDRIGMRNHLLTNVSWIQAASEDEAPNYVKWRRRLDRKSESDESSGHLVTPYNPYDVCRSLRAFTAQKGKS